VTLLRVELPVVIDQHMVLTDPALEHARAYLDDVKRRLRLPARIETIARVGPPAQTILEVAEEIGATQILLTSGRRGRLARWLFGSVVQQVVRRSTIPVLVIPAAEARRVAV
jgi:nucleotide-binding universal stress UspA family protein